MDFRISANLCLCASVTVARLYGRTSSVPKPGIHMFQFLSRTLYIYLYLYAYVSTYNIFIFLIFLWFITTWKLSSLYFAH